MHRIIIGVDPEFPAPKSFPNFENQEFVCHFGCSDLRHCYGDFLDFNAKKPEPTAESESFEMGESRSEMIEDGVKWISLGAILIVLVLIVKLEYDSSKHEADQLNELYLNQDGLNGSSFDLDEAYNEEEFASFSPYSSVLGNSLESIYFKVYRPRGLFVDLETKPLVTLKYLQRPSCLVPFLEYAAKYTNYRGAEGKIERLEDEKSPILMGGMAKLIDSPYKFLNKWSTKNLLNYTGLYEFPKISEVQPIFWRDTQWQWGSVGLHHAFSHHSINGKRGLILGSDSKKPWVENFSIMHGAESLLILEEERVIGNEDQRLRYINPLQIAKEVESHMAGYDFAVSFSQLGHRGLGSNGEILEANGDLDALFRLSCLLKKDGLLYLGEAVGRDSVEFNTRRIYGRIRLPMLFAGFELVSAYLNSQSDPITLDSNWLDTEHPILYIPVFVLRKK